MFITNLKGTLKSLAVMAVFAAAPSMWAQESQCFAHVQGQIAWDYQGTRSWSPANVQNLCRGTQRPSEPGRCFDRAMHGGINWGGGTTWQWENALNLCQGTNAADSTITCFQSKIAEGAAWPSAIQQCKMPEAACASDVQGKIAWDYQGTRTWNPSNVQNLCRGTSVASEPGRCFDRAMHGGINWGGGTTWQWENALNLCQGTNFADSTIACFQAKIAQGMPWSNAIQQCK